MMIRVFYVLFVITLAALPAPGYADALPLGTVETEMDEAGIVVITPAPDRPRVLPEELVRIESRIPGVDEAVESSSGYVFATANGVFKVKITDGEPAFGEDVVLLGRRFLNGAAPTDEETWRRMGYEDLRRGINKPANPGAACALAKMHEEGVEIEKNTYSAFVLYGLASQHGPSANCAAEYGMRLLMGDLENDPPQWSVDPDEGVYWLRHASERGSYLGTLGYATALGLMGDVGGSERWFKKAIEIEPESAEGTAQRQWDDVRKLQSK